MTTFTPSTLSRELIDYINDPQLYHTQYNQYTNNKLTPISNNQIKHIKLITLGNSNTGKSCIIKRYCERKFHDTYICTIGIDYGIKHIVVDTVLHNIINNQSDDNGIINSNQYVQCKLNFFDLAGSIEYSSIRYEFIQNSDIILLVYDIMNKQSYYDIGAWLDEYKQYNNKTNIDQPSQIYVVCNKIDLLQPQTDHISIDEVQAYCNQHNCIYMETSAATGHNIELLFNTVISNWSKLHHN